MNSDTWYTGHDSDQAQFYAFVWNVFRYSRKKPTEKELRELILDRWHKKLDRQTLENVALNYSGLYATLLDFAKSKNEGGMLLLPIEAIHQLKNPSIGSK